jgi:hypothetical protein
MKGPDAILIFLLHSNQELMNEFYKFIKPKGIENSVWSNDAYSNYQEYDTPIRKHSQQLPAAV